MPTTTADGYLSDHQQALHTAIATAVSGAIKSRAARPLAAVAHSLLEADGDGEIARLRAENARLKAEVEHLTTDSAGKVFARQAAGDLRGVSAQNQALYRMGALRHEPPRFQFFDPKEMEQRPVLIKEVKLPFSAQTHEVCYEPVSRCLFIT